MAQVVGQNARELRRRANWSQDHLVEEIKPYGVSWSRTTVSQMESGKRPTTVDELLALAVVFNVSPDTLTKWPRDAEYAFAESAPPTTAPVADAPDVADALRVVESLRPLLRQLEAAVGKQEREGD